MKKIIIYFSFIFIAYSNINAANLDSLIYFKDLNFSSERASSAFKNFVSDNNKSLFDLLLTTNENVNENKIKDAQVRLNDCVNTLTKKTIDESENEKVKTITKYVQKNFLKVYNFKGNFLELFETGSYNNLSEMSLYAVILTEIKIPFQLVENANSIYIYVFPATSKIEIKSKESEKRHFDFTDHFKKKFALSLYYNHSIPREELEKSSDEILFDKYYFANEQLTMQTLAAFHFRNKALYLLDEKKINDGMGEMIKNYLLSPSASNQFTLKYNLINSLGSDNYTSQNDVDKLIILCRLFNINDPEITSDFIVAEHKRLVEAYTLIKSESETYEDFHSQVMNSLRNTDTKNELEFNFNSIIARTLMLNQQESNIIFKHIEKAYKVNPQNKDLHSLIIQNFSSTIMKLGDSEAVLSIIEEYDRKFDFVHKTSPIMRVKANCLLDLAFKNFNKGLMDKGNEYLDASLKTSQPISLIPDEVYIEKAYLEAARNYYVAGNKIKAKEYLNKGLELAPQSIKLKDKLKMVN